MVSEAFRHGTHRQQHIHSTVIIGFFVPSVDRHHLTISGQPAEAECQAVPDEASAASERLRVGDLAKRTGVTVRAIHHYEALGLIEPVARSKGHYRLFAADTPVRIRWINKLKSLGLSLSDIRSLVQERQGTESARRAAAALRTTYQEKLVEVRERLGELRALEAELESSLTYLDACGTGCTPRLVPTDCAQCERQSEAHDIDLINGALI